MGKPTKTSSSKVDLAPPTKRIENGKRDAEKVVEKQVTGSKKQKLVDNGSVELAVDKTTVEIKKEQTSPSEESTPEEEQNKVEVALACELATTQDKKKASSLDEESREEHRGDSPKEEDDPKESDAIVEMVDAPSLKLPQTTITSQATGSKTLFMGNLSFSIEEDDVKQFFKDAGEIAQIRFCMREDRFAGYGHVEFTTHEAALEALKLNGELLVDRPVRLDLAREREKGAHPSTASLATGSKTVFMGNLSFSIEEDDVKNFFKDVGEIARVRFCMREDRFVGYGHVEFTTHEAALEALKLNGEILVDRPVRLDLAREREKGAHPLTTSLATGSKTVYMGNLSLSIEEDDIEKFFKDVGEVTEVRFAMKDDRFVGFAHVEFTTARAAQEALKLNNELLLDRPVKLDLAKEHAPGSSKGKSYQKGGPAQGKTIFVRGFNTSDGFENIRSTLEEHFGKCGEISRLYIPKDYGSGALKGVAFIDFTDGYGFSRALELNGSEVGGGTITVEEAKSRSDTHEGSGRGFGGGRSGGSGRFGGGPGGRFSGGRGWQRSRT